MSDKTDAGAIAAKMLAEKRRRWHERRSAFYETRKLAEEIVVASTSPRLFGTVDEERQLYVSAINRVVGFRNFIGEFNEPVPTEENDLG